MELAGATLPNPQWLAVDWQEAENTKDDAFQDELSSTTNIRGMRRPLTHPSHHAFDEQKWTLVAP